MYDVPIQWVSETPGTSRHYVVWRVRWTNGKETGSWELVGDSGSATSVVREVQRRNIAAHTTGEAFRYRALPVGVRP